MLEIHSRVIYCIAIRNLTIHLQRTTLPIPPNRPFFHPVIRGNQSPPKSQVIQTEPEPTLPKHPHLRPRHLIRKALKRLKQYSHTVSKRFVSSD